MFVRRKKNRSGTTSVVVADKSSGAFTELKVIGVGTTEEEIRALVKDGKEWIAHYAGQQTISFPDEAAEQLKTGGRCDDLAHRVQYSRDIPRQSSIKSTKRQEQGTVGKNRPQIKTEITPWI